MGKSYRKISVWFLMFLMLFTLTACGQDNGQETEEIIKKQVNIQDISRQNEVETSLVLSGTVVPQEYSVIRSLTPGTIEYLAPVGSEVVIGQPLFSIRDEAIENNYFNSLQSFQQTSATTGQRVQQAELALNSSKARLDLARVQYENTVAQTKQNIKTVQDSAIVSYSSAYNDLNQFFLFLNTASDLTEQDFVYKNLLTPQSEFKKSIERNFYTTLNSFNKIKKQTTALSLEEDLADMQEILSNSKNIADDLSVLLQNAVPSTQFSELSISANRSVVLSYQASISQYLGATINAINSLVNTKVSNTLSVNNAQSQLDLAKIEYNNSEIALQSAKDGSELEKTISQSQLDNAAYNYNNLTLASPFSGTVLSHYAKAGEQASAGQEMIEIGNLSLIEISVDIDVNYAKAIKLNDKVLIEEKYEGFVAEVEPIGDLQSGKVSVKVQSESAGQNLTAGSIADIKFDLRYQEENVIVVPIKSVTVESSGNYVFVLNAENIVERKSVSLGQVFGDKVSVLSGLEEGERLVLLNGVFVSAGEEVEVKQ